MPLGSWTTKTAGADSSPQEFRELLEDFADAQAAREALAEIEAGAEPIPAEQAWAELGLGS